MKKLSYAFVFVTLIMLPASSTRAQTVPTDPRMGGGGGGSCMSFNNSSSQDISVPTGCVVDFVNDLNTTLKFEDVTVNSSFTGTLSCIIDLTFADGSSPFSTATLISPNTCRFSGGAITPDDAVPPGGTLGVQFGYPDAPFPAGPLNVSVTTAPEPASIALIGTGLAAWLARRKKLGASR